MNIHDLPFDAHVHHRHLPRSSWLRVNFRGLDLTRRALSKMRFANAARFELFGIEVIVRRPWLAGPARQLHPELFPKKEPRHDD